MKLYNYFLFRLYWVFRDFVKEGHKMSLISTSIFSTIVLYFALYGIVGLIYFFKASTSINLGVDYKFWLLLFMFILWFLNYEIFIKPRKFLKKDFKKDRIGGILILFFFILLGFLMVIAGNKNREKIVEEKKATMESKIIL